MNFVNLISGNMSASEIVFFITDILLIVAAVAILIWVLVKMSKSKKSMSKKLDKNVEKIDGDTYVFKTTIKTTKDGQTNEEEVTFPDNNVEHFSNQISQITNQPEELSAEALKTEVGDEDRPKVAVKQEVSNFVTTDNKTNVEKLQQDAKLNRGNTFESSANFFDKLKQVAEDDGKTKTAKSPKSTKTTSKK